MPEGFRTLRRRESCTAGTGVPPCASAGKTGSCFPDERAEALQCVFRIPLPHMGIRNVYFKAGE